MAIGFDPEPSRYDCPLLFQWLRSIPPAIVAEKVPILLLLMPGGQFSSWELGQATKTYTTERKRAGWQVKISLSVIPHAVPLLPMMIDRNLIGIFFDLNTGTIGLR